METNRQWQTEDGLTMFSRTWLPDSKPEGVIVIVHGLGEHSGRYQHVAAFFVKRGWAVTAFDHRGHGQSQGRRGVVASRDSLIRDTAKFLQDQQHHFTDIPWVLYGHSMGGAVVLNYILKEQPLTPAAAVVTGPALRTSTPKLQQLLVRASAVLAPKIVMKSGLAVSGLSSDPAVVQAYQDDPLVHDKISPLLAAALFDMGAKALDLAPSLSVPLILCHGADDPICRAAGSRDFAAKAPQTVLTIWPGLRHEIHNEPQHMEVLDAIWAEMQRLTADPAHPKPNAAAGGPIEPGPVFASFSLL